MLVCLAVTIQLSTDQTINSKNYRYSHKRYNGGISYNLQKYIETAPTQ